MDTITITPDTTKQVKEVKVKVTKPFTKYCNLPPFTVAAGHDTVTNSFYVVTKEHTRNINVEIDEESFKQVYCKECTYYQSTEYISNMLKAQGAMPTPAKVISYCENNELCNSSPMLMNSCMAGHSLEESAQVEIKVPYLLWIWAYNSTGKGVWRVYALESYTPGDSEVEARPYLLGNVYDNPAGAICWKKKQGSLKVPQDLQQAYYTFFNAPFNKETSPAGIINLTDYVKNYDVFMDSKAEDAKFNFDFESVERWIEGDTYKSLMYTNDPKVLSTFSQKVHQNQSSLFAGLRPTETSTYTLVDANGFTSLKIGKLKGTTKCKVLYKTDDVLKTRYED